MTLEQIQREHPLLPRLLRECLEVFEVPDGKENSRIVVATQARSALILILRQQYKPQFTLKQLGSILALLTGRETAYDHASIIYLLRTANDAMLLRDEISQKFRDNVLLLKEKHFPAVFATNWKPITKPLRCPIY